MNYEELETLLSQANQHNIVGRYAEAERLANEVYEKVRTLGESDNQLTVDQTNALSCSALINMSISNWRRSDFNKALRFAHDSVELAEASPIIELKANAYGNLGNVYFYFSECTLALDNYNKAVDINKEIGNKEELAKNLGNIGSVYNKLSDFAQALHYRLQALEIFEEIGRKDAIAVNLGNIGLVYHNLSEEELAIEYYEKALQINEELGKKDAAAIILGNLACAYISLSNFEEALISNQKALDINTEIGRKHSIAGNLGSIGLIYLKLKDYPKAIDYLMKSLALNEEIGKRESIAANLEHIGYILFQKDFEGYDEVKAEAYLLKVKSIFEEIGNKMDLYGIHKILADLYENQERWKESHTHLKQYLLLEKEVLNEETKKKAAFVEQQKKAAEREKEIQIAKATAAATINATTTLLHKVLPQSIATRMIESEEEIADYFTSVSILFADIEGFTPISAQMPAIIVVRFLNAVFGEFDRIMQQYGCEKIKTIGDGYMAAAGVPIGCEDHAERIAAAAFEMIETLSIPEDIREYMPEGTKLGIRIGLHSGPVVAGVIGQDRFVYDIYSDAVNTAARMESHGMTNRVHVSADFALHLQNRFMMTKNTTHGINFENRGEIEVKGKGKMKTYFLDKKAT